VQNGIASLLGSAFALSIHVLVPRVEPVDVFLREGFQLAELPSKVHAARDVFAHHRRLDGIGCVATDGEHTVVGHQHRTGAMTVEGGDDATACRARLSAGRCRR
jgi:hypothetical protein